MKLNVETLEKFLQKNSIYEYKLEKITEEGSNRIYYRIRNKNINQTFILCQTFPFIAENDDFINLSIYLINKNARVPKIIDFSPENGWILLEDAGSLYLQDVVNYYKNNQNKDKIIKMYKIIIKEICDWHSYKDIPNFVLKRKFDKDKFQFEIEFFYHNLKKQNLILPSFELQAFLSDVIETLCKQKELVFTHRDFHSRNILLHKISEDYKIIDYQDARMGLPWYDLSSLLFDPYVEFDITTIMILFDYYYKLTNFSKNKYEYYKNIFFLQALQRLFKALGSFIYLGFELNKIHFRKYIIPTIKQISSLAKIARFPDIVYLYCKNFIKFYENEYAT